MCRFLFSRAVCPLTSLLFLETPSPSTVRAARCRISLVFKFHEMEFCCVLFGYLRIGLSDFL